MMLGIALACLLGGTLRLGLAQKAVLACGSMVLYVFIYVIFTPLGENNIHTGKSEGGVRPNFCRRDHLGEATEEFDQARERYVQGRTRAARRAESAAGRRSVGRDGSAGSAAYAADG